MSDRFVDQLLVERAQKGELKAFEMLVLKYQQRLIRLIARFVESEAEAEDIAQEAFIKAYRALPDFRGESAFYTWLYRIGVNTTNNYLVERRRKLPQNILPAGMQEDELSEHNLLLSDDNTPETTLMNKEIVQTIERSIEHLPQELKVAITLREIDGLSYEDIAQILECPVGTVRSRIFRAREAIVKKLRPMIESNGVKRW